MPQRTWRQDRTNQVTSKSPRAIPDSLGALPTLTSYHSCRQKSSRSKQSSLCFEVVHPHEGSNAGPLTKDVLVNALIDALVNILIDTLLNNALVNAMTSALMNLLV
jgi:hypothetical protein